MCASVPEADSMWACHGTMSWQAQARVRRDGLDFTADHTGQGLGGSPGVMRVVPHAYCAVSPVVRAAAKRVQG